MGSTIIFDGDRTLNELVDMLKNNIKQDTYLTAVCEIDGSFLLEITLMKKEEYDS